MYNYLPSFADFYSAVLLLIIGFIVIRKKDYFTTRERVFFAMIITTLSLLVIEGLSFLVDGNTMAHCYILNYVTNYYLYLITPLNALLWVAYIDITMTGSTDHFIKNPLYKIFIFVGLVPILINPFTDIIFSISASNIFMRGSFYWIAVVNFYALTLYVLGLTIMYRKKVEKFVFGSIIFLVLMPPIGGLLQVFFLGVASIHTTLALGIMMVYMSIETMNAARDSLTKSFTRRKALSLMDAYVRSNTPFTAVLLDMDNLKEINDTYGHHEGDNALVDIANALRKECTHHYIVARMGGDEFLVMTKLMNADDIEERLQSMKTQLNQNRDIALEYSWGYYMKQADKTLSVDDILMTIDERMYQQKAINKNYKRRRSDKQV